MGSVADGNVVVERTGVDKLLPGYEAQVLVCFKLSVLRFGLLSMFIRVASRKALSDQRLKLHASAVTKRGYP